MRHTYLQQKERRPMCKCSRYISVFFIKITELLAVCISLVSLSQCMHMVLMGLSFLSSVLCYMKGA